MSSGDPPAVEMARELESWAAAFCDDGARHHAQQKEVMKLELDVECNPLSAQFSGRLYALMEQEEQAAQRGQTDAHARLSETVNVMMNQETKAHFDRQAEYSNKRWRALFEQRLAKELDAADKAVVAQHAALIKALLGSGGGAAAAAALPSSVDAAKAQLSAAHRGLGGAAEAPTASPSSVAAFGGDASSGSAAVGLGTRDGGPAPRDSAACWRGRLRLQATAAWGDNEKYHLQVAFGNQISRVEDEWGAYEVQLNNDYEAQRADIEGRHQPDRGMQAPSPSSGKQWKDKAKQESLIHTAPVHSPTAAIPASPKRSGGGAGAGGGAGSSVAAQRELRQLDSSYRQAQQQFRTQKAAALRWIQRQADRMYTQAAAHAATTTFVGACVAAHTERRLLVLLRAECCVAAVRAALAGALQAAAAAAPAAASASSAPVGVGAALEVLRNLRQRAGDAEGLRARGGGGGGGSGRMLQQRAGAGGGGGGGGGASSQQMKKAGGARAQTAAGRTRPRKQQW